jgi:hypothetical protein
MRSTGSFDFRRFLILQSPLGQSPWFIYPERWAAPVGALATCAIDSAGLWKKNSKKRGRERETFLVNP